MTEAPSARPLTGTQYRIASGGYEATVTQLGAGLRALHHDGRALITSYDADELPPHGAGQLLAPWPNRVDGGAYTFFEHRYQLGLSEPARGNAIHGLTRWLGWQVTDHQGEQVELRLDLLGHSGYPFCLELRARYQLSADGLQVTVTASNPGTRPAPFGTGSHPYLLAGTGGVDDWHLELPAASWQPADDRGIPAGEPRDVAGTQYDFRAGSAIGGTQLDTAFTGLAAGGDGRVRARLTGPDGLTELWAGPGYRWLQVFTGDALGPDARRAVAIEPMTCPPNALASGTDLLVIEPGASVAFTWGIQAG